MILRGQNNPGAWDSRESLDTSHLETSVCWAVSEIRAENPPHVSFKKQSRTISVITLGSSRASTAWEETNAPAATSPNEDGMLCGLRMFQYAPRCGVAFSAASPFPSASSDCCCCSGAAAAAAAPDDSGTMGSGETISSPPVEAANRLIRSPPRVLPVLLLAGGGVDEGTREMAWGVATHLRGLVCFVVDVENTSLLWRGGLTNERDMTAPFVQHDTAARKRTRVPVVPNDRVGGTLAIGDGRALRWVALRILKKGRLRQHLRFPPPSPPLQNHFSIRAGI